MRSDERGVRKKRQARQCQWISVSGLEDIPLFKTEGKKPFFGIVS